VTYSGASTLNSSSTGTPDVDGAITLKTAKVLGNQVKEPCDPAAQPTDPNRYIAARRADTTLERLEKSLPPTAAALPSLTCHHNSAVLPASLLRHHLDHHRIANRNFGVTTKLWDRVFRTMLR
jgi:hypothetical protein